MYVMQEVCRISRQPKIEKWQGQHSQAGGPRAWCLRKKKMDERVRSKRHRKMAVTVGL